MDIQIRRASSDEANLLTQIAHEAKRHWGYPETWIEHWKNELTITPEFIAANEVFVAEIDREVAGCCALVINDDLAELEHMWVRPPHMGSGVGRALFLYVRERAAGLGRAVVELSADPNAEGFYERMGARRIGEVPAEVEGEQRILPRMSVDLARS
jgi:N-acetylglutamate synthase-like GNAT family acetyltransferase